MEKKIVIPVAVGCSTLLIIVLIAIISLLSPFFTPKELYFDKVNKAMNKYCNTGLFSYECKNPAGALVELKKIASSNPKYYYAYYKIGDIYRQQRDYQNAIYYFKKAIETEQVNPEVYSWLGTCYNSSGQQDSALETYKKGIELFPEHRMLYMSISNIYLSRKDIESAIKYYSKPDILKKNHEYNLDSARLLSTLGRYNDSIKTLDKFDGTINILHRDCKVVEAAEGFKAALGCRFVEGSSSSMENMTGLSFGDIHKTFRFALYADNYMKLGNYDKAIEYLNKAEEAVNFDEEEVMDRTFQKIKGRKMTDAERKAAKKDFERRKKYDARYKENDITEMSETQRKLIEAYALKGDIKTANKLYEKYGANGNYKVSLNLSGDKEVYEGYISFAKRDYKSAKANFKQAVEKNPKSCASEPKLGLARTYMKQGEYEAALEIFKSLRKHRWYDYEFNRDLAECYSQLGDEDKAQEYFEIASRLKGERK